MKISIIIPIYNVEHYVLDCLRSVARQNWDGAMECVVVDDCGTDASMDKVRSFVSGYDGDVDFKIVCHDHNRGLSAARNTGLEVSTGDYVFFIDSDDYISDDCMSLMAHQVRLHTDVEVVEGMIQSIPYKEYYDRKGLKSLDYLDSNSAVKNCFYDLYINATNKLVSREYLQRNRIIFKEGLIHEDELWSYYLYRSLERLAIVHEVTYWHPLNQGSIMTSMTQDKDSKCWSEIMEELIGEIDDFGASRLERYYLTQAMSHNSGNADWIKIRSQIVSSLRNCGRWLEAKVVEAFDRTGDMYYVYWIMYHMEKPYLRRLMLLGRHKFRLAFT